MSKKIRHFYKFGEFTFSPKEKCLRCNGENLQISPKALEVLDLLLERNTEIVLREELVAQVWKDTFVEEANLTVAISILRKTFEENTSSPKQFIQTVPKKGYRFIAEIKEITDGENETPPIEPVISPNRADKKNKIRWHFIAIILLGVLFLASFSMWLQYYNETGLSSVPVNERNIRSIAVLPLKNLSQSEKGKIFSLGLTDNLIGRLGKLNRFAVRPLSSVEKFSEGNLDALDYGEKLKVDAVVVGTIQIDTKIVRLHIRLLDVRDGADIWSQTFDETERNIFDLQDDLSKQIASNLLSGLSAKDNQILAEDETTNLEAFQEYSKGQYHLSKRTSEDLKKAIDLFERAIELDENYASAYTSLAECYILLSDSIIAYLKPGINAEKTKKALERALELNPNSAETYATLGFFVFNNEWNVKKSVEYFEKAISLNPNLAKARHWYAWILLAENRFEEAQTQMKIAQKLDPTSMIIASEMGIPTLFAGEYEESIPYFRQAVELDGNYYLAHFRLWYALYFSERYEEAMEELGAMKRIESENQVFYLVTYGMTLWKTKNRAKAEGILEDLEKRTAAGEYVSPIWLASLSAEMGKKDKAFKWLEVAFEEHNDYMLYLGNSPEYRNLRDDQRFRELIKKIKSTGNL
jgi:DNA-binding winged helix-turn-helix (wHTH) protein/TolB-like protein/Tfp pilus assembly protein PilF